MGILSMLAAYHGAIAPHRLPDVIALVQDTRRFVASLASPWPMFASVGLTCEEAYASLSGGGAADTSNITSVRVLQAWMLSRVMYASGAAEFVLDLPTDKQREEQSRLARAYLAMHSHAIKEASQPAGFRLPAWRCGKPMYSPPAGYPNGAVPPMMPIAPNAAGYAESLAGKHPETVSESLSELYPALGEGQVLREPNVDRGSVLETSLPQVRLPALDDLMTLLGPEAQHGVGLLGLPK